MNKPGHRVDAESWLTGLSENEELKQQAPTVAEAAGELLQTAKAMVLGRHQTNRALYLTSSGEAAPVARGGLTLFLPRFGGELLDESVELHQKTGWARCLKKLCPEARRRTLSGPLAENLQRLAAYVASADKQVVPPAHLAGPEGYSEGLARTLAKLIRLEMKSISLDQPKEAIDKALVGRTRKSLILLTQPERMASQDLSQLLQDLEGSAQEKGLVVLLDPSRQARREAVLVEMEPDPEGLPIQGVDLSPPEKTDPSGST